MSFPAGSSPSWDEGCLALDHPHARGSQGQEVLAPVAADEQEPVAAVERQAAGDGQPPDTDRGLDHAGTAQAPDEEQQEAQHGGQGADAAQAVGEERGGGVHGSRLPGVGAAGPPAGCELAEAPGHGFTLALEKRHQLLQLVDQGHGPGACCRRLALACGRHLGHEPGQRRKLDGLPGADPPPRLGSTADQMLEVRLAHGGGAPLSANALSSR